MTTPFNYSFTDAFGEVHSANLRVDTGGWNYCKNGNFKQYISIANSGEQAVKIGMALERMSEDAEKSFNAQHPELNP